MNVISALFIGKIADAAADRGLNRAELLQGCGVDPDERINPGQMVVVERHYAMWEVIMRKLRDPGFPLEYAATIQPEDYGALGLAGKTAPDLRESWNRAVRYFTVLTNSAWLECRETRNSARLILRREGQRDLGLRCATEAAVAEFLHFSRVITGVDLKPPRVNFQHPAPEGCSAHAAFFGGEVCFNASQDCIEFTLEQFDLPVLKADDGMSLFFVDQLEQTQTDRPIERSLVESLHRLVCDALPSGSPAMDDVARRLGMSARTLQRRLGDVDTTFQKFVERTRADLATHLLKETGHPLAEIAFLLGFSEQSAFQRAFKRWHGLTPAEYRLR